MEKMLSPERRKQLERKMREAFKGEVKTLSEELQQILADDLVTAFQNRVTVLMRIQSIQSQ